jgi:hypothetical protein
MDTDLARNIHLQIDEFDKPIESLSQLIFQIEDTAERKAINLKLIDVINTLQDTQYEIRQSKGWTLEDFETPDPSNETN